MGYYLKHYQGIKSIQAIAAKNEKSVAEVRRDMQKAIDAAWSGNNLTQLELQSQLFPNGKPTPEEFIEVMSRKIKSK